ncbi:MAG: family 78 glycoside hydrolase catalytic domain, partial [Clostridiales bacterium]|nr:family 78 glycoside hydrolase catalytic domain [Clostridiales bacterium]
MKKGLKKLLGIVLAVSIIASSGIPAAAQEASASSAAIVKLQTEYTSNPIGMDKTTPRFSWQMTDLIRGQRQTAYQIMVADSAQNLAAGNYVWDSGKVESDLSVSIPYEGPALKATTRYFWQVKVWDKNGSTATSTEEAYFETGLMGTDLSVWSDAKWITVPNQEVSSTEASSQYSMEADFIIPTNPEQLATNDNYAPWWVGAGFCYGYSGKENYETCRLTVNQVDRQQVEISCGGRGTKLSDIVNAEDLLDKPFHLKVEFNGANAKIYINSEMVWETNINRARDLSYGLGYFNGRTSQQLFSDNFLVKDGEGNVIYAEDFSDPVNTVFGEQFIDVQQDGWARLNGQPLALNTKEHQKFKPAPMFRKDFSADKGAVKDARLYASAAGVYEFYINGKNVTDTYLNPGNIAYNTRMNYQTYDVTELVKEGGNAIGATLGNGWYNGAGEQVWGDHLALLGKLVVTYENGEQDVIVTDGSWSLYEDGPVRSEDIWHGEWYDANKELDRWTEYGYDTTAWNQAVERAPSSWSNNTALVAQVDPPVRNVATLEPVSANKLENGNVVYDFGQEITGICRVTVKGEKGDAITLRHGEWLNEENMNMKDGPVGSVWTRNLLGTQAVDRYILKGDANSEVFEPSLVYHGFRYMELVDLDESVEVLKVEGLVLSSDTEMTGTYESSNPMVNQLYSNTVWSQVGNFLSIPMDCPQRTERYGWTGDAQIYSRTASYTSNVLTFYSDYVQDMLDSQVSTGIIRDISPMPNCDGTGNNGWGDAIVIIPWNMYQQYGTTDIIEQAYDGMYAWIEWLQRGSDDWIRPDDGYGDHLSMESYDKAQVNTAWCVRICDLMSKMADVTGRTEDAAKFAEYRDNYKAAWNREFVAAPGKTVSDTQTSYVLGLSFDIFPEEDRAQAAENLVANIKCNGSHLQTGFAGVGYLNPALSDMNQSDIAYALLEQQEYPSWLYAVTKGATTVWEQWDAYQEYENGTHLVTGSLNHFSYGSIAEWLYRYSAGIDRDEANPGFKHIILQPAIGGSMTYVNGSYDSVYGKIVSNWELTDDGLVYHATVPANTTATLSLPEADYMESGVLAGEADGITFVGVENGKAVYELQSGSYEFAEIPAVEPSIKAVDASGAEIKSVVANELFTIEATTGLNVKAVALFNEYGLKMGLKNVKAVNNGDGTVTWTAETSISTVSKARTLQLVTIGTDGTYQPTDAKITIAVTGAKAAVISASIEETAVVNKAV